MSKSSRYINQKAVKFYTAEKILSKRIIDGKTAYLIKWKGYGLDKSTYEFIDNLRNIKDWVNLFEFCYDPDKNDNSIKIIPNKKPECKNQMKLDKVFPLYNSCETKKHSKLYSNHKNNKMSTKKGQNILKNHDTNIGETTNYFEFQPYIDDSNKSSSGEKYYKDAQFSGFTLNNLEPENKESNIINKKLLNKKILKSTNKSNMSKHQKNSTETCHIEAVYFANAKAKIFFNDTGNNIKDKSYDITSARSKFGKVVVNHLLIDWWNKFMKEIILD